MYQRQRFVLDAEHTTASFAELCRRYAVSRKTGYKWLERDPLRRGRAPVVHPHQQFVIGRGPVIVVEAHRFREPAEHVDVRQALAGPADRRLVQHDVQVTPGDASS
jgi:hypothetical protein